MTRDAGAFLGLLFVLGVVYVVAYSHGYHVGLRVAEAYDCPICGNPGDHLGCRADLAHDEAGDR